MMEWRETIDKALDWIEDNLTDAFTLPDLANQARYSPFYFSRLFHLGTGMTIKKYIADRRLYRAALEIRDTKERIIDTAVKYGFSSQEAMTRALKSAYGCTPNELRRNPYLVALTAPKVVLPSENNVKDFTEKGKQSMTGFSRKLVNFNVVSSDPRRLAYFYRDILDADICEEHGGPHRIEIWFGERDESSACIVANYDEGFQPQTFTPARGLRFMYRTPTRNTNGFVVWALR